MTTIVSRYGQFDQKGTVLGIFRSLGALGRALGPVIGSMGVYNLLLINLFSLRYNTTFISQDNRNNLENLFKLIRPYLR